MRIVIGLIGIAAAAVLIYFVVVLMKGEKLG